MVVVVKWREENVMKKDGGTTTMFLDDYHDESGGLNS